MNETIFDVEDKMLLKEIINSPSSFGAFTGMIFNALINNDRQDIDYLIKKALEIKKRVKKLSEV